MPSPKQRLNNETLIQPYWSFDMNNPKSPILDDYSSVDGDIYDDNRAGLGIHKGYIPSEEVAKTIHQSQTFMPNKLTNNPIQNLAGTTPNKYVAAPSNDFDAFTKQNDKIQEQKARETVQKDIPQRESSQNSMNDFNRTVQRFQRDLSQKQVVQQTANTVFNDASQNASEEIPPNQEQANAKFLQGLSLTLNNLVTGADDQKDFKSTSLEGTTIGGILNTGDDQTKGFSMNSFQEFLKNPEKYGDYMKKVNPKFDTNILMDVRDRMKKQASVTYGEQFGKDVDAAHAELLTERKLSGLNLDMPSIGDVGAALDESKTREAIKHQTNPGESYDTTTYKQITAGYDALESKLDDSNTSIADQIQRFSPEKLEKMKLSAGEKGMTSNFISMIKGEGSGTNWRERAITGGMEDPDSQAYHAWKITNQKSGEKIDESVIGEVDEGEGKSRATEALVDTVRLAYDPEYQEEYQKKTGMHEEMVKIQSTLARSGLERTYKTDKLKQLWSQTPEGKEQAAKEQSVLREQQEPQYQQFLKNFGVDVAQTGASALDISKSMYSGIAKGLQGKTPEALQQSGEKIDQTARGFYTDEKTGAQKETQRQDLEDRLLIDPFARQQYAKDNNIPVESMNRWAEQTTQQNFQQFGEEYQRGLLGKAAELEQPGRYSKEDIQDADLSQVNFASINQFAIETQQERQRQYQQNQEELRQEQQQALETQRQQAQRAQLGTLDNRIAAQIHEEKSGVQEDETKVAREHELQTEEDLNLREEMRQADAERPAKQAKAADLAEGKRMEATIGESLPSPAAKIEDQAVKASALKELGNRGLKIMGRREDIQEQDSSKGNVDETKPGIVWENGVKRPTKTQAQINYFAANPDEIPKDAGENVLAGAQLLRERAMYTEKNVQQEETQQQISLPSSNVQSQMSNFSGNPNLESGLLSGTAPRPPSSIPETENDQGGVDTIVMSSGQTIRGDTASNILQNNQTQDVGSNFEDYVNQKIKENNDQLSVTFGEQMNDTAYFVSEQNLNQACEGL